MCFLGDIYMVRNVMRYFSLLHLTSNRGYKGIMKSEKIKKSIHDIENGKIQWLGDGIYFWDINDSYAIKLGKNLIRGRNRFKFTQVIGIKIELWI